MRVSCILFVATQALFIMTATGNDFELNLDRNLQTTCSSDAGCGAGTFCSQGLCRLYGTCDSLIDCHNPSNMVMRQECQGYDTCVEGKCEYVCSMGESCPNNDTVSCFAPPCEVGSCSELYVSCVDNYCGECNAIYFALDGSQACAFSEDSICTSDTECEPGYFCTEQVCIPYGYCRKELDCQNPDNLYLENVTIICLGYHECNSDIGQCQFVCGETNCPNNDEVSCDSDLCETLECNEPYEHCMVENCGRCKPIYISESGTQVCQNVEPAQDPVCDYADCEDLTGFTQIQCYFDTFFCFLNNL